MAQKAKTETYIDRDGKRVQRDPDSPETQQQLVLGELRKADDADQEQAQTS